MKIAKNRLRLFSLAPVHLICGVLPVQAVKFRRSTGSRPTGALELSHNSWLTVKSCIYSRKRIEEHNKCHLRTVNNLRPWFLETESFISQPKRFNLVKPIHVWIKIASNKNRCLSPPTIRIQWTSSWTWNVILL